MSGQRFTSPTGVKYNPTERLRELEQFVHDKPAETVGRLAATEQALAGLLRRLPKRASGELTPELAKLQREFVIPVSDPPLPRDSVRFRRGYERQIVRLHGFV